MIWSDFHAAVRSFLGAFAEDANPIRRRQVEQAIRSGCLRMQQVIETYQTGHETTFKEDDLVVECYASRGDMPDGASIQSVWLHCSKADCEESGRVKLRQVDWEQREDMIDGTMRDRNIWTIDPNGNRFYVAPILEEGHELHVIWNGLKVDFGETDTLPWGEEAAETVSNFVNAQLERMARDKINNHFSFMSDWRQGLALLSVRENERRNER